MNDTTVTGLLVLFIGIGLLVVAVQGWANARAARRERDRILHVQRNVETLSLGQAADLEGILDAYYAAEQGEQRDLPEAAR